MTLGSRGKSSLLAALSSITRRHAVLLPRDASAEAATLHVASTYRVTPPALSLDILEQSAGSLSVSLLAYDGHFPRRIVWERNGIDFNGPASLVLDFRDGSLALSGRILGKIELPLPTRRFAVRLELARPDAVQLSRTTGHYLPASGDEVGESYYKGDDYVDYDAQAQSEAAEIVKLLDRHRALDPILEIGAATGVILGELEKAGHEVTGIDLSQWAVEQTALRLGEGKNFHANVDAGELPAEVSTRGPFSTLLLWAVLEHLRDPFGALARLNQYTSDNATLVINTTNAASLSHRLFGSDWEGYFDWTHYGVDTVSAESLRSELPQLGWNVIELYTHSFWHSGVDPDHAVLRDTFAYDARFGRLLRSRDLGDFLVCVARKASPA